MTIEDLRNLDQEQIDKLYLAMEGSYELFAKVCMGHIVRDVPEYHTTIYSALDKRHEYNAFIVFRGGAKSTISKTIQCSADMCFAREPFTLLISESIDQASKDLISITDEIENNEIIRSMFGLLEGTLWNKEEVEATNGAFIKCKGYGSRIRGLKWKNIRPTKIILDDYESEYNTGTHKQREAVKQWISAQVLPAGSPGETTFQFIGTIVHKDSHLASIKELDIVNPPLGVYMEIPVEVDGIPAWASRFPMKYIKQKEAEYRQKGKFAMWMQEMYHKPFNLAKPFFNTSMITEMNMTFHKAGQITWLEDPLTMEKIPCNVYIGVDPAISLSEGSDNTIILALAVLPDKRKIILDIYVGKILPTEQRDIILKMAQQYTPVAVTIETQGYQGALENMVSEKMSASGDYFNIRTFKSNVSKSNKWLEGLEPEVNSGFISYLRDTPNINTLFIEMQSYNKEDREHDDTIDALYLANLNAYPPSSFNVDEMLAMQKERSMKRKVKKVNNYMFY